MVKSIKSIRGVREKHRISSLRNRTTCLTNTDTKASDADISLTTHIEKVSKLLNRPLIEHFIIAGENIFEFSKDPALVSELTKNAQESKTIYLEHQEELER